jgi:electron transfer flavoprotein beta subunit
MNLIVCVKQVPDTEAKIIIANDGKSIDDSEVNYILNPYDEYAIEEALRIKETKQEGEVILISAGTEKAAKALRSGLAMGADRAILVADEALAMSDPLTSAILLERVIKDLDYDIIFCGQQGIGGDNSQVGAMLAELLNIPQVCVVTKLELLDGKIKAHRQIEGLTEVVEANLPAVITAQKGLNEPRYPSLRGIMMAKKKPLEQKSLADLGLTSEDMGEAGAKIKITKLELPPKRSAGKVVEGEPQEVVKQLLDWMQKEAKLI